MKASAQRARFVTLAAVLTVWASAWSRADEPRSIPRTPKEAKTDAERASGVILKVEKIAGAQAAGSEKESAQKLRLTVNMAAVWRDWARDQAAARPDQSPTTAAKEGANSVATQGEPRSKEMLVTIDLGPDSQVETRFRAPDDETSKGAKTPAASEDKNDPSKRQAAKPTVYRAQDLKAGLFVEVDFRRKDEKNVASRVAVIRPVK